MDNYFKSQVEKLNKEVNEFVDNVDMFKSLYSNTEFQVDIPKDFENNFFKLIDKVNLSLLEDKENFYGYFIFQMSRKIRFDISTPSGVNFKGNKYIIYFNPVLFLQLNIDQMKTTIKHEIYHIIAWHLVREKDIKNKYNKLAINSAMDMVVNQYLNNLPPYAITVRSINLKYSLELEPYDTFEHYAEAIQRAIELKDYDEKGEIIDDFDPETTHDIWDESEDIDENTLRDFTEKFISNAEKGSIPLQLENMIASLRSSKSELPWNIYLKRLIGTVESNKKKTITRRNRRQPNRLDLKGEIRNHKAEVIVAIDISGSISDEEFKQAIKEVLSIVKNYNHEITIIECDNEIRRTYKVSNVRDVKDRVASGGGTRFTPVFNYANKKRANLLVYFTDGKGEDKLDIIPKGYKTLWVISGRGEGLSLKNPYGVVKKLSKVKDEDILVELKDLKHDGYSMNAQEPII